MKKDKEFIKKYSEYFEEKKKIECMICQKEKELYGELNSKYTKEQLLSFYKTRNLLRESLFPFYIISAILLIPILLSLGIEDKSSLDLPLMMLFGSIGIISLSSAIIVHVKQYKINKLLKEGL